MLKITAIGNLTRDVELKMDESTGIPYTILRIASDRRYRNRAGEKITDFISIKVRGPLAERCAEMHFPTRAASWPPPGTLKPSFFPRTPAVSRVSSSRPTRWSFCPPGGWTREPQPSPRRSNPVRLLNEEHRY